MEREQMRSPRTMLEWLENESENNRKVGPKLQMAGVHSFSSRRVGRGLRDILGIS